MIEYQIWPAIEHLAVYLCSCYIFLPKLPGRAGIASSIGTREQFGLTYRPAYVELLRHSEATTLPVLNEVLFHTVKDRLDRLKRLLYDVSSATKCDDDLPTGPLARPGCAVRDFAETLRPATKLHLIIVGTPPNQSARPPFTELDVRPLRLGAEWSALTPPYRMAIQAQSFTPPSLNDIRQMSEAVAALAAGMELRQLVELVGVDTEGKLQRNWASDVHKHIHGLVEPDAYGVRSHVRQLQAQLICQHELDGAALEPFGSLLRAVMSTRATDRLRRTGAPVDWKAIVESAFAYSQLSPNSGVPFSAVTHPREYTVAAASKRLRSRGYMVDITLIGATLPEQDHHRLVDRLHELVARLGGLQVLITIFSSLKKHFDPAMGRYHLIRGHRLGDKPTPATPFGYLVAIAAKHLDKPVPKTDGDTLYAELVSLATDYATIHDVQEYISPMWARPSAQDVPQLLARRALADSLFTFPQLRRGDVCRILRGVLKPLPPEFRNRSGWTLEDLLTVTEHVYRSLDRDGPMVLKLRNLSRGAPGIDPNRAKAILLGVFAHPPHGPNTKFRRPTDRTVRGADPLAGPGNTTYLRPLIRLGADCLLVIDRTLAAPAFVEAVLNAFRPDIPEFQSKVIGPGLETFVADELSAHGVATVCGNYEPGSSDGECDLVIDSTDRTAFFELKAKALTRDAGAGVDTAVALSLAGSLISAQQQAMGHELRLRKEGQLTLVSKVDGSTHVVDWHGQDVDRIAIGLFDFGGFQDRTAVQQILVHTLRAQYTAHDADGQEISQSEFKSFNKSLNKIAKHYQDWLSLGEKGSAAFFNTWFLSVPQLLLILDDVRGPDDFFRNLGAIRNITYQTYNFYYEYREVRKLRSSTRA